MDSVVNKIFSKDLLHSGYYSYLFALISVIIIPIHIQYLPPVLILWCISWLIENPGHLSFSWNSSSKYKILFMLFILYYLWQVFGLLYTSDINKGISNLFTRLSLILFPMVLLVPGDMIIKKTKILLRIFAFSTFIFLIVCFLYALYRSLYFQNGELTFNPHPPEFPWLSYFYGYYLCIPQHPSYIAMYTLLAFFICIESSFDGSGTPTKRFLWSVMGLFFFVSQYFLSSRAGILISLISIIIYSVFKSNELKKGKFAWLFVFVIILLLIPVIIKNQRIGLFVDSVIKEQNGEQEKVEPRFIIWESALKIVSKNFILGVGSGDARTDLAAELTKLGEDKLAKDKFNAHNQFLEVLLENGIIGLLIFLGLIGFMIYLAVSEKNLLYGMFIIMMVSFFMFETILYRLAGVSFFSMFSFMILNNKGFAKIKN